MPAAAPAASLPRRSVRRSGGRLVRRVVRRVVRGARRELAGWRWTTVREPAADSGPRQLRGQRLRLVLPDAAALVQVAAAGRLTGQVRGLDLRLAAAPESQLTGLRPPRLGRTAAGFSWRRRGRRLRVVLRWSRPYDVARALDDVLRAVLRARAWDQLGGPVFALDAAGWRDGRSSWPQGRLAPAPPEVEADELGRPLGPYLASPPAYAAPRPSRPAGSAGAALAPIVTAVANPYGRTLVGRATPYQLERDDGRVVLRDAAGSEVWHAAGSVMWHASAAAHHPLAKYAVVRVDRPMTGDRFTTEVVRTLAACGVVFAAPDPAVRAGLDALGLVTVADAAAVADLAGYGYSVAAARQMALAGDPALRRTALGGDGAVPLPGVTAVVSTKRAEHLQTLLGYLAGQTYPALEAVIGLHGYDLSEPARRELAGSLPFPVRIVTFPAGQTLGQVLGRLSRMADGEFITKLDDDDHYGPHHVTDLFLAWHTSGADLVAKGARFVHFPERGETIDRAWAAPEVFDVTPAGGTMLLSRGTLAQVGGWSHSSRHVDADLLARVRATGGVVYRTHALEYVYVRRSGGHTFVAGIDELLAHGERTYPGLPSEIVHPGAVPHVPV